MLADLNLAQPQRLRAYRISRALTWVAGLLCLAGLLLGVRLYGSQTELQRLSHTLTELNASSANAPKPPEKISAARQQAQDAEVAFVNRLIAMDAFSWGDLFIDLEHTLVDGIRLDAIQPDPKTRTVKLQGKARTIEHLQQYLRALLNSEAFADTDLQSHRLVTDKKRGTSSHLEFALTLKQAF